MAVEHRTVLGDVGEVTMTENHGIGVRLLSLPWLQELEAATLHGERAGYCGNDGCDEFQHLKDGVPIYFDHLRFLYIFKHGL